MAYRVFVLDSTHEDYASVLAALGTTTAANYTSTWNQVVRDASHDANIKLVGAVVEDADLVGDLAPLADANWGDGVYKDRYLTQAEKELRAFGLLGEGDYADQIWYVRPRTTYSTVDGSPTTQVTYGDQSGKTYGDALSGVVGYAAATFTGPSRIYFVGEHIIGTEDMRVDGKTVVAVGEVDISASGTDANTRHEIRFDLGDVSHNGVTLDRGIYYGGLMLNDTTKPWVNGVVKLPYTQSVALVEGDRSLTITMDTDGDTGQILDWDGSNIWILTDGTAGNSFDNSPTSNDTFTITLGTGAGSQNGAATAESNLWTYPAMPSNLPQYTWFYDPGTAFGNGVHKGNYTTKTTSWGTQDVADADGGNELNKTTTMSACSSTEATYFFRSGNGGPCVVHLPGGADPTDRVMASGFGVRLCFAETISHVALYGERCRQFHDTDTGAPNITKIYPRDNFLVSDFSRKFSGSGFLFPIALSTQASADRSNYEFINGYLGRGGSGIYPVREETGGSIYIIDGLTIQDVFAEEMGGTVAEEASNDGHAIGFQGNTKNITIQRVTANNCGGAIVLYQFGEWITFTTHHQWGTILIEDVDISGTSANYPQVASQSANVGIALNGDNADEASIGNGKATPPTTKQDVSDVTIRRIKVRGKRINIRDKWRDYSTAWSALDLDTAIDADFQQSGSDSASANVVRLPYTESIALVASDVGKAITMDTDGDTGTIIDYDGSDILIITDGTAGNSFDNSPTANDTFTITTGTGAGSQNGAGAYEPARAPRSQIRSSTFGGNSPSFFSGVATADGSTDAVIDSDQNTFVTTAAATLFNGQTFAQWKANSRAGSTYDPTSTLQAP